MQSIAQDLGIKGIKSLDRDSLIYRILDGQAMQNSKSGAPAVVKEENRMNRREHRRNRIHADSSSKVYTATGDKAVKLDKEEPKKQNPEPVEPVKEFKKQDVVVEVAAPVVEKAEQAVADATPKAKKRGRKPKSEKAVEEVVATAPATEEKSVEAAPAAEAPAAE